MLNSKKKERIWQTESEVAVFATMDMGKQGWTDFYNWSSIVNLEEAIIITSYKNTIMTYQGDQRIMVQSWS